MTNDELEDKIGAMYQQLLHDEEQYCTLLGHLCNYYKDNKHYAQDVLTALTDGLDNQYRYQKIENAIELKEYKAQAPRCHGLLFKPGDSQIQRIEK